MGLDRPIDIAADQRKTVLALLEKYLPNTTAWIYGSRTQWAARPQSDLDMVVFATPEQIDRVSSLREAFEESNLPFRVDLFVWDAVPEEFRKHIETGHVVLTEREERGMAGEWQTALWGELATLEYGKSLRGYDSSEGPYRVYGTNGPIGWHSETLCSHPSVIIGRKGAYRGVHYSASPFFVIDTAFYLKPNVEIDTRWAYYELLTQDINGMDSGSAIPSTSREDFYGLPVQVPPLSEQRAIAHILGTLDDKIELNRRMNETLEAMARALFKSWFVDFDPVRAKMEGRDTGLPKHLADLFPDRLVDSEFGKIPEGWEVRPLGDLVETVKGRSYKSKELIKSETALVTLKSFARGGGYRPEGLKSFSGTYKSDQVVDPGEIVIACTDVTQAADVIGRPAIVQAAVTYRTLVASLDTLIVRPSHPGMTRAFLYFLTGNDEFVAHTYAYTTGTTVLHLAKEAVPSFRFPPPPTLLIHSFDDVARPALERIQTSQQESTSLATIRNTLLPKLISGEVRVKDAETFFHRMP